MAYPLEQQPDVSGWDRKAFGYRNSNRTGVQTLTVPAGKTFYLHGMYMDEQYGYFSNVKIDGIAVGTDWQAKTWPKWTAKGSTIEVGAACWECKSSVSYESHCELMLIGYFVSN